jgi:ABC-type sugar transport system ATPase subunit
LFRIFLREKKEKQLSQEVIRTLNINTTGDNQNLPIFRREPAKSRVGKWLASTPEVIILDEPTRELTPMRVKRFTPISKNWRKRELVLF